MAKEVVYIRTNNYGCGSMIFDMFMLIITGGLWLLWIIARYLRTH